jgi:hypothetical protein
VDVKVESEFIALTLEIADVIWAAVLPILALVARGP